MDLNLMNALSAAFEPSSGLMEMPKNPRWVIVSEAVEHSTHRKVLKAGRVVKRAQYRDRNKYTGEMLRALRKLRGVGRLHWSYIRKHGYYGNG